jgi:tRNA-dihydrouridine synthase A
MIPLSIAPMMDRTDRHYRWFMRRITRRTLLYTEMVTTGAILHGDRSYLLDFDPSEHPIAFQVGGDDPVALAQCARIVEDHGYDEINLNVGCPSSRVQKGCFGAALMKRPERVAEAVAAMRDAVDIEVTVKHRIGVDDLDRYEDMANFVSVVARAGCKRFSVHARKAWLQGLSPKENRNIPPLRYGEVHQLKEAFPHLDIEINGGIKTTDAVLEQLQHVDGVMIGRGAYDDPWWFGELEQAVFGEPCPSADRFEVAEALIGYVDAFEKTGQPGHRAWRHALNLFAGIRGAKAWKRTLTVGHKEPARVIIPAAIEAVRAIQEPTRMSA